MTDVKSFHTPSCMQAGARIALGFALVLVSLPATSQTTKAHTFRTVYSFQGSTDGGNPLGTLVLDGSGNLYGTAQQGGDAQCNNGHGCGAVFKIDSTGAETVLYAFTGGSDGVSPQAGLTRDGAGNLYGTTYGEDGDGATAFKVAANGQHTVLYTFSCCSLPLGGLVLGKSGNLYGTAGEIDNGMVFKLNPAGQLTVLHSFNGMPDGLYPDGGLIMDQKGDLIGTTYEGGAGPCLDGCGTVFKVTQKGNETILYRFLDFPDGALPGAGVILGAGGEFYGTTDVGGLQGCNVWDNPAGCGAVFKVDPSGREDVLYRFRPEKNEGLPDGVIRDADSNLYGLTFLGTAFKLDKHGKETILHRFAGGPEGVYPSGSLVRDPAGHLYGVTYYGGTYGNGSVFEITP